MTGEELYERVYDARVNGSIGTTGVPWSEVPVSEKQEWEGIAGQPRTWLYGLTADEWLHLAAEGQDSEVAPCCGDIGQLREWLNGLAAAQGAGESHMFHKVVLDAYAVALADHDTLADEQVFPLLHRVLAGVREELAAWDALIATHRKPGEQETSS
jgi:hypothetical protein